jgi:hypothetical protein
MDKLEHYLDQVCRSIGGTRAFRQHIRQELREHLRDAAAEHRTAGLSEDEALDRALADFGGPDQVRAELEATHGHRLLPVVIDKAMQWKEKTMKARWLWASSAHLLLGLVIALELWFLVFATIFLVPKFQKLNSDGLVDSTQLREHNLQWMPAFLHDLAHGIEFQLPWLLLAAAILWGLFEWRVRSEHKSFMRLSAFGTVAAVLMIVVSLTAAAMILPFLVGAPMKIQVHANLAAMQIASIDDSVSSIEKAIPMPDWQEMEKNARGAFRSAVSLRLVTALPDTANTSLSDTLQALDDALKAIQAKDTGRLKAALEQFHKSYAPVHEAIRARTNEAAVRALIASP